MQDLIKSYCKKIKMCALAGLLSVNLVNLQANNTPFHITLEDSRELFSGLPVKVLKIYGKKNGIVLKHVRANDDNCRLEPTGNWKVNLNTGEYASAMLTCKLIKLEIDSNVGNFSYTF